MSLNFQILRFVTTQSANTDQNTTALIGTLYYTSTIKKYPRILYRLCLKVGNMVLLIRLNREAKFLTTLRLTLIQMLLFQTYLRLNRYALVRYIPNFLVFLYLNLLKKKLLKKDLNFLTQRTLLFLIKLSNFIPPKIYEITITPKLRDLVNYLLTTK